ncbi:MAG: VOC family protein [Bacteroidetes bacterium]|nr:VOC family protein [Bacteroidota bacterium]MCW5895756.1 VOC family protein [Bacteroidota bacterium]
MARVVHFEIQAANPDRAIEFYSNLFDWKFQKFPGNTPYWLISTGSPEEPGIDGGLLPRNGSLPAEGAAVNCYVCTVQVSSVDESVKKATERGGMNVVPKMAIPGVGWLAYCKDPEGNIFGVMQPDTSAA